MDIFEDLVTELKEENLLENTVIENKPTAEKGKPKKAEGFSASEPEKEVTLGSKHSQEPSANKPEQKETVSESKANSFSDKDLSVDAEQSNRKAEIASKQEVPPVKEDVKAQVYNSDNQSDKIKLPKTDSEEKEFYRQRAIDEVTGLQMVEHVLTGVEREQMKVSSAAYNDIKVKQALHNFLKVADDLKSPDHAKAEFNLMQETEDWYSSLSRRDRNVSVSHIRRYCETTKPALSSQALLALARFYRNSPYTESVRSKFDLIITRLFSKEAKDERRELLFDKEELIKHLKELYADWASVPLYSTQDDDSDILLSVLQFQEFIDEAKEAEKFDDLVKKDFFKRIKVFKEKTHETFFSPQLVAAAIESNVIVGNIYVELIEKERKSDNDLEEKYGVIHDKAISEATSKTLELLELIKEKKPIPQTEKQSEEPKQKSAHKKKVKEEKVKDKSATKKESDGKIFGVNKWILFASVFVIGFSIWFYFGQSSQPVDEKEDKLPPGVVKVNLERSFLKDHIHKARISKESFFAIAKPSWSDLDRNEKMEFLKKIQQLGKEKNFNKVMILDEEGKALATANESSVNVNG